MWISRKSYMAVLDKVAWLENQQVVQTKELFPNEHDHYFLGLQFTTSSTLQNEFIKLRSAFCRVVKLLHIEDYHTPETNTLQISTADQFPFNPNR